jgi:putative RecB family exonuclease
MADPAEQAKDGTQVDGVNVLGAISPSRAGDFKTCPLLYRYRAIDKLPEAPSAAAVRGTLVHQVLEDLFDLPAAQRTPEQAEALLSAAWEQVLAERPESAVLVPAPEDLEAWLASCTPFLRSYFELEDPQRLEPAERELYVETLLDSKLLLRGVVDRIDVAPDGAIRVVDYKTGRSVSESNEAKALFQMRFYALVLWRMRGVVPKMLRLVYLGNSEILSYEPDEQDLLATQRQVEALWEAIATARGTGEWLPRKSQMCGWCSYKPHCPEFGGTILPLPDHQLAQGGSIEPDQAVGEHAPIALEDRDVVRHDQHGAASGLG